MRYFMIAVCLAATLAAEIPENEALALRRIADFWEEGEYQIAKNQMESFLNEFPDSSYGDTLSSALGDLFLREKSYQTALNYYAHIQDSARADRIFLHRMQCLYHLEWHATLADECEAYLKKESADPTERLQATYLLAIALYQQCLTKESSALTTLAERAKPYFEQLSHSELSEEVAGAFAHLQCILKDFKGASKIYLDLAEKSRQPEEYLFQAALIQSKYDQNLALETFNQLASREEGYYAKEATYNKLVLYFEQQRFEDITAAKEQFFKLAPRDKLGLVHLFVGQSYLHLEKYSEAAAELNAFLDSDIPEDRMRPALLHLLEAAYQAEDIALLDQAIARLEAEDPEMPKSLFSRALLFKKQQRIPESKEQLESLLAKFRHFAERPQASFELTQLHSLAKEWDACREACFAFIKEFPKHELVSFAWRTLLAASSKTDFISDLEVMLKAEDFLEPAERTDWQFLLAKAYFEQGNQEKALQILTPILSAEFTQRANAELLFAFCLRDTRKDEENFCVFGEKALAHQATLLPISQQHVALFNSYLKQNKSNAAANHLYAALLENAKLQSTNLFWLAHHFYQCYEKDPSFANQAFEVLTRIPWTSLEDAEPFLVKLAKLHRDLGRPGEAIALLEELDAQYRASVKTPWQCEKEARVCLADLYSLAKELEKAEKLYDEVGSGSLRDRFSVQAALQSVRLKPTTDFEKIVSRLKEIVLQKKLENEPLHLEAALDYIELQSQKDPAKRLPLLQKTKADFEAQDDLLSKDYHAAREKLSEQAKVYFDYMKYLDAEILVQQNELHTKAKEILLQIKAEAKEPLLSRVETLLKKI